MKVLGIESSCDETGIAVYDTIDGQIWQRLYSQIEQHREYGGVVPELASRAHVRLIIPVVRQALDDAGVDWGELEGIAATQIVTTVMAA